MMRKYLWVVECKCVELDDWYPLVDYVRRSREETRVLLKELQKQAKLGAAKWNVKYTMVYRVRKYVGS